MRQFINELFNINNEFQTTPKFGVNFSFYFLRNLFLFSNKHKCIFDSMRFFFQTTIVKCWH